MQDMQCAAVESAPALNWRATKWKSAVVFMTVYTMPFTLQQPQFKWSTAADVAECFNLGQLDWKFNSNWSPGIIEVLLTQTEAADALARMMGGWSNTGD